MRIGFLNPTILIRRPIAELADELQARGHRVTIFAPTTGRAKPVAAHFESERVQRIALPSWDIPAVLWSWPTWRAVRRLWVACREFDVIHIWAPYYLIAVLPIVFCRLQSRGAKVVVTFDTFPGFSFKFASIIDPLMRMYHWFVGSWLFRLAAIRTVYSRQLLPYAQRAWLGSSFTVLSSGIHLVDRLPTHRRSAKLEILFIGILNRRKGVAILLEAAAQLQSAGHAVRVRLVGDGPDRKVFEKQVRRLNLLPSVEFLGRQNNVRSLFASADILVLPSYGEGLPGVVMEAMMYGVPVVSTNIPCLSDLIPNPSYGRLVPPGDALALAAAMLAYFQDESMTRQTTIHARSQIEEYSWTKMVPHYEALYAQVA